jgi:hypothetical protein
MKRLDENYDGPFELVTKINGGLLLKVIKEIDREKRDHYEYELIAFDNGQPKKQSSTKLFIQIDVKKKFPKANFIFLFIRI